MSEKKTRRPAPPNNMVELLDQMRQSPEDAALIFAALSALARYMECVVEVMEQ